jgi:acetoin utilization deacetylase AcuC-like enzyme
MLKLYYDPIYTEGLDPTVRFPRERYQLLAKRLKENSSIHIQCPPLATREQIVTAHDEPYVDLFLAGKLEPATIRRIGLRPWTPAIVERTLRLVGGSLAALGHALSNSSIAGNMAGGTHHAYRDCGSGYCIFNDVAICALAALKNPRIKKVLILDLDVHQGDGTAAILQEHPDIFTCSIHAEGNFPFRKQQSDLDVHLADETKDADYLACLDRTLEKIQAQNYDCILYQAGVDPLEEDALGRLALTRNGLHQRNERIFQLHRQYNLPLVIFMGGGYAKPIERSVDAFEDLFTEASHYTI